MSRLENDGQIQGIQDFLSSADYSRQALRLVQQEKTREQAVHLKKMKQLIDGFEKINDFWSQRVVHTFQEEGNRTNDLAIVNVPIVEFSSNSVLNVRYLAVAKNGFGYMKFSFDETEEGSKTGCVLDLFSPAGDKQYTTHLLAGDNVKTNQIECLRGLNGYFSQYNTYVPTYGTKLFNFDGTQLAITHDGLTSRLKVDFSDIENQEIIQGDLQNIFGQLEAKRQEQIDEENQKLQVVENRLRIAEKVSGILSNGLGINTETEPKKKSIFDKFKRKQGK